MTVFKSSVNFEHPFFATSWQSDLADVKIKFSPSLIVPSSCGTVSSLPHFDLQKVPIFHFITFCSIGHTEQVLLAI